MKSTTDQSASPAERRRGLSRQELLSLIDSVHDTVYRTDAAGRLIFVSRSVQRLLGYRPAELLGSNLADLYLHPGGRSAFLDALRQAGGDIEDYETELLNKNGDVVWVSVSSHFYRAPNGDVLGVEGVARDVTSRVLQQRELNRLKTTLDKTLDCVFLFEPQSLQFFYCNEGAQKQVGYSTEELLHMTPFDIKPEYDETAFRSLVQPLIRGERDSLTFDTVHRHKDGHDLPVEVFLQYIKPANEEPRFVAIVRDLTERIQTQEQLRHMAHHDSLTALPNRHLFIDRLEHALERSRRRGRLAVLFLDLDRFKVINDTLGHASGDKVLRLLGARIEKCIRKGDTLARLSGDEFAILLEDLCSNEEIVQIAKHVLQVLEVPFLVEGHELFVSASIGISEFPNDGHDSHSLLKYADIAMYRAKDAGRNTYQFYSPEMSARALERLSLETSLRYALERGQFTVAYQPQMDVKSGRIVGFEALLRWQHPDLGLVMPDDFIPILEETGLIVSVGQWALRTACSQARVWQERFDPDLRIAINLSARQFHDADLAADIQSCLTQTGLRASTLELEITETILMQDQKWTTSTFRALKSMNVRLALDDFGTGYSSLSYLKRFPIHALKIDSSFVRDVPTNPDDAAIVSAIIAMASNLQLQTIAEGVETGSQLDFIRDKGCQTTQGFLVSRPLTAEQTEGYLSGNAKPAAEQLAECL